LSAIAGALSAGCRNGESLLAGGFRVTVHEDAFLDRAKSPKARRAFADSGGLVSRSGLRGCHPAATLLDLPQQFLYFLPLPQGQGSLRPTRCPTLRIGSGRSGSERWVSAGEACWSAW